MKEIYMHIGPPKTGTTALQLFLDKNKNILKRLGIYYPYFSREVESVGGYGYGNALCLCDLEKDIVEFGEAEYFLVQKIEDVLELNQKILFSSEGLWHRSHRISENLLKLLGDKYDIRIKNIVYLRRQDEWLESLWNQTVKAGLTSETFESNVQRALGFEKYIYDLERISAAIGKDNLFVRIYDQERFSKGDENSIYADFMSLLGVEDLSEFEIPESRVNPSLGQNIVEIQRVFNSIPNVALMQPKIKAAGRNIEKIMDKGSIVKTPPLMNYEQRKSILDFYEEENRKIGREYFGIDASPFPPLEKPQEAENVNIFDRGGVFSTPRYCWLLRADFSQSGAGNRKAALCCG